MGGPEEILKNNTMSPLSYILNTLIKRGALSLEGLTKEVTLNLVPNNHQYVNLVNISGNRVMPVIRRSPIFDL